MGYCMSMSDATFFVSTENVGRFLSVLWRYPYDYTFDADGNITEIEYVGEKLGRDYELFQKVAPFVRDGTSLKCTVKMANGGGGPSRTASAVR